MSEEVVIHTTDTAEEIERKLLLIGGEMACRLQEQEQLLNRLGWQRTARVERAIAAARAVLDELEALR